jgi:voltage-gated potassium channel
MSYSTLKQRTYRLLNPQKGGRIGRITDLAIMLLILLSVIGIMLGTVDVVEEQYGTFLRYFEIFCVAVFSVEYVARIWSITASEEYRDPVTGRFRYALTPYLMIDLLAILPFYLGGIIDLRFLRAIRLFRVFRVLKIARYSDSITTIGKVLRRKQADLIVAIVVTSILLVITSSLMYFAERGAQPEEFSSIPATFWWGVVTLTTVGYGDIVPATHLGQLLAGVFSFLGVGLFGLPASILASGFIEEATGENKSNQGIEEETITLPQDEYKKHNQRRQEMGLTWSEYIDRQSHIKESLRDVINEELESSTPTE